MKTKQAGSAATSKQVVDRYFLEHRAKVIDIAAFLDRVDRAGGAGDYRVAALSKALDVLTDGQRDRAARILAIFSDQTAELTQSAEGVKGATGTARMEGDS